MAFKESEISRVMCSDVFCAHKPYFLMLGHRSIKVLISHDPVITSGQFPTNKKACTRDSMKYHKQRIFVGMELRKFHKIFVYQQ